MKTILLIEDDPFLIDLYSTRLKAAGFEIDVATNGQEGLEKVREKKPDLLVLDMVLPTIDGWEVLKELKKEERFKDLKILIFSNLDQKADIEGAFRFGVTKYLIKAHYTPTEVIKEIEKILK
ncbi:response regulator [Patescibacteria group bacterium]